MTAPMNLSAVRRHYHLSHKDATALLENVKPLVEVPYAAGMMRMYDPKDVAAAIEPVLHARRVAKGAAAPLPTPAEPGPATDLTPLAKRLDEALDTIAYLQSASEKLAAQVAQVTSQHAVLLKAIEKVGLDLGNKLDALQQTVDQMDTPAPTVGPIEAGPATTPPPAAPPQLKAVDSTAPKRKVTTIGLFDAHATHIHREFKDVFDLRIYNIDEAKGAGVMNRMKDSEAVFIMTKFVNHSVENLAKAAGVKPIRVTGGQTAIRDRLTELFCNQPQKAA